jgi:hypothetical protein
MQKNPPVEPSLRWLYCVKETAPSLPVPSVHESASSQRRDPVRQGSPFRMAANISVDNVCKNSGQLALVRSSRCTGCFSPSECPGDEVNR